ncbi:MAG: isocitrate lyase/phosphoenolpyruvate mutase family protein [Pseudomonadota bacterium]
MQQEEKARIFRALHAGETFIIPNPWDIGTARILTQLGYKALATTSAGYAFTRGLRDSDWAIGRAEMLAHAREVVEATDLPVSADLESGFGDAPEDAAETITEAAGIGLVGGSIEDVSSDRDSPIYAFNHAVERITAAVEAARALPFPFVLTARAENFLHGRPDLDDTIKRLQAFEKAGADVLYAPGLRDIDSIRQVCASVSKPVNVVMGLAGASFSLSELSEVGVTRISVGSALSRAALGAFLRAAEEMRDHGTFSFADDAATFATLTPYMKETPR